MLWKKKNQAQDDFLWFQTKPCLLWLLSIYVKRIGYSAAVIAVETFSLLLCFDVSFADLRSWSRLGLEHTLFLKIPFDSKQVRPRSLWLLSIYYSNRLLSCCHRCGNFFIAAPLHSRLGKYWFEAFLAKSLRLYKCDDTPPR